MYQFIILAFTCLILVKVPIFLTVCYTFGLLLFIFDSENNEDMLTMVRYTDPAIGILVLPWLWPIVYGMYFMYDNNKIFKSKLMRLWQKIPFGYMACFFTAPNFYVTLNKDHTISIKDTSTNKTELCSFEELGEMKEQILPILEKIGITISI